MDYYTFLKYQNSTYNPYAANHPQNQLPPQNQQTPQPYFGRIQPPAPQPEPTVNTESMYRGRGIWRQHHQFISRPRDVKPYRRRRSHLDDVYLPNYEDIDDLTEHDDSDFQPRERICHRNSSRGRGDYHRRPYFKVIPTGNKNNSRSTLEKLTPKDNIQSKDGKNATEQDKLKQSNGDNSQPKPPVEKSLDQPSACPLKSECDSILRKSDVATITQVQNKSEANDDRNNNCDAVNDNKGETEIDNTEAKLGLCNIDKNSDKENKSGVTNLQLVNVTTNSDKSQCHDKEDKTDKTSDIKKDSNNLSEGVSQTPEVTEHVSQPMRKLSRSSPIICLNLSPKTPRAAKESSPVCHLTPIQIPTWKTMLQEVKVTHVMDVDSDQETVCLDEFITVDNIDTKRSFLNPGEQLPDDYRIIDMDIGTPSPAKRKTDDNIDEVPNKKTKIDSLYADINSDDLLTQINEVLNENKPTCSKKDPKKLRFRSKSLVIESRTVETICLARSKSEQTICRQPKTFNFDLKENLLLSLAHYKDIKFNPTDDVKTLLKILKENKKNGISKKDCYENESTSNHNVKNDKKSVLEPQKCNTPSNVNDTNNGSNNIIKGKEQVVECQKRSNIPKIDHVDLKSDTTRKEKEPVVKVQNYNNVPNKIDHMIEESDTTRKKKEPVGEVQSHIDEGRDKVEKEKELVLEAQKCNNIQNKIEEKDKETNKVRKTKEPVSEAQKCDIIPNKITHMNQESDKIVKNKQPVLEAQKCNNAQIKNDNIDRGSNIMQKEKELRTNAVRPSDPRLQKKVYSERSQTKSNASLAHDPQPKENSSTCNRKSNEKEALKSKNAKRRAESPASVKPEKQTKSTSSDKSDPKPRPLTLGEYKKTIDISKRFPPPKIDLVDIATDENYRQKRTTYSSTTDPLIKKINWKTLFGEYDSEEESSLVANTSSDKNINKGENEKSSIGIKDDPKPKPVSQEPRTEKHSDKRNKPPPPTNKRKNEPSTSGKSEKGSHPQMSNAKNIEKGQRRTSLPITLDVGCQADVSKLKRSQSQHSEKKPVGTSTKQSLASDKKPSSHASSQKDSKFDTKTKCSATKPNISGRNEKSCIKSVNSTNRPDSNKTGTGSNSSTTANSKGTMKLKVTSITKDKDGKMSKTNNSTVAKYGEKKQNIASTSQTGAHKIGNKNDKSATVNEETTVQGSNGKDQKEINAANHTKTTSVQAKIILNRVDDVPVKPVSPARQISERINFALITESSYIKCGVLCQERFPMRQKARVYHVENECCDQAVILDSADIQDDSTTVEQQTTKETTVEDKDTDEVIEIKSDIPIIDLTDDDVKEEEYDKDNIKKDLDAQEDNTTPHDTITLYRSEETVNIGLEVQATSASISPVALNDKNNDVEIKIDALETVNQTSITPIATTDVSQSAQSTELSAQPVVPIAPMPAGTLPISPNTCSLIERAIDEAIKHRERQLAEKSRTEPEQPRPTASSSQTTYTPNVTITQTETPVSGTGIPITAVSHNNIPYHHSQGTRPTTNERSNFTFVKPPPPPPSNQNVPSKAPTSGQQYEVIRTPRRSDDDDDHHTLMQVPCSPRRTEDSSTTNSTSQFRRVPETALEGLRQYVAGQTPRRTDNAISSVPSSMRYNEIIDASSSPRRGSLELVTQSPRRVDTSPRSEVRQSPRRNDAVQIVSDVAAQEMTKLGAILIRYLLFFDSLRKAQLAYTEELKKSQRFLSFDVTRELKRFDDENSQKFYELSGQVVAALEGLNLTSVVENPHRAQALVESTFRSLKEVIPTLTLTWVYLMLEALMSPEKVHYLGVPFLRALYKVVALVTIRIRSSAAGAQMANGNNAQRELMSAEQKRLLAYQIHQYGAIWTKQKELIALEQEVRNNNSRARQIPTQPQNIPPNTLQTNNNRLPTQPQFNGVGNSFSGGVVTVTNLPSCSTTCPSPRRNSTGANPALLRYLLQPSVNQSQMLNQPAPLNVQIHPSVLIGENVQSHVIPDSTDNKSNKKGRKKRATAASRQPDDFRIRLPLSQPYDMLPSSSTTTTSANSSQSMSVLHSPAAHRITQSSPAHQFVTPPGTPLGNIPNLTPIAEATTSHVYSPILLPTRPPMASPPPNANDVSRPPMASPPPNAKDVSRPPIASPPPTANDVPRSPMVSPPPNANDVPRPSMVSPPRSDVPSHSGTDSPGQNRIPDPSTPNLNTVLHLPTVKDENESPCSLSHELQTLGHEMETIDLTWMDDIDPEQLQTEIDYIVVKKEEPVEEEERQEAEALVEEEVQEANEVMSSPADSGIASPPQQGDISEEVFAGRKCICNKPAEYVCECRTAMYCSEPCQAKDWKAHKEICQQSLRNKENQSKPDENTDKEDSNNA